METRWRTAWRRCRGGASRWCAGVLGQRRQVAAYGAGCLLVLPPSAAVQAVRLGSSGQAGVVWVGRVHSLQQCVEAANPRPRRE